MSWPAHIIGMVVGIAVPAFLVSAWLGAARSNLEDSAPTVAQVAVASAAEAEYCSPELKKIVRRVAGACGLIQQEGRGCQPADAAKVVSLTGEDFNALFMPLSDRVRIVEYDVNEAEVDAAAAETIEAAWADRGGASFFFVVARASTDGDAEKNRALSEGRAKAVMDHLRQRFADPDIERQVGLLWLGEEFAQLDADFCSWSRSRADQPCDAKTINRSAFIAWIDCSI